LKVLGIIPVRGGSKGILRKNLVPLAGRPLIGYTIRAALASTSLKRTILSSEDDEIMAVARSLGVDVPLESGSLWGRKTLAYVMPPACSVNIDSLVDLRVAESMLVG
jgi:CMP-N-acetylneuraminic acid synthetase